MHHDEEVLICQQIDDCAAAVDKVSSADSLFAILEKNIDMTSQGTLTLYNRVDINQRREYIKIHATSYITRILKVHGWDKHAPDKKGKQPIKPIYPDFFKILEQTKGPRSKDTKGQAVLRKRWDLDIDSA